MKSNILSKGSVVGVCAPSSPVTNDNKIEMKSTKKLLETYGLSVIYSDNIYSNTLGYSASVVDKVDDINRLINDKNIEVIFFAKGGNNAISILNYIDYEAIKKNPKIFIGFSDISVILNAIYTKTGLITYHFTTYKGFWESNDFNKKQFENNFINGFKGEVSKNTNWITLRDGIASGKLIGGNIATLCKLIGTEYFPDSRGSILFIEEFFLESSAEELSSSLYRLKDYGLFDNINGILIGNYDNCDFSLEDILFDVIGECKYPVLKCNDFGHTDSRIVLPIGLNVTIDGNKSSLIFDEYSVNVDD